MERREGRIGKEGRCVGLIGRSKKGRDERKGGEKKGIKKIG